MRVCSRSDPASRIPHKPVASVVDTFDEDESAACGEPTRDGLCTAITAVAAHFTDTR